LGGSTPNALV